MKTIKASGGLTGVALGAALVGAALGSPTLVYGDAVGAADEGASKTDASAPSGGGNALDEIVVTAQKREQSTQKIGLSITAFKGDQLDDLQVRDISDLAALVPGFTVATSFGGTPIYTLRGVGFNTPNMSTSSPVGVYMDEVAYPYPIMTEGPSFDIERVEVLKGPQGTLYGRNTTGGLINEIARKPGTETDGEVDVTFGNYGDKILQGFYNQPITDTLQARGAFYVERSNDGWQRNIVNGETIGKINKSAARLSLNWEPASNVKFALTGNWWEDKSDETETQSIFTYAKGLASAGVPQSQWTTVGPLLGVPLAVVLPSLPSHQRHASNWVTQQTPWGGTVGGHNFTPAPINDLAKDNHLSSLALRGDIGLADAVKLTSLTSFSDFSRNEPIDPAGMAIEDFISVEAGSIQTFSQEFRLSGETDALSWIGGISYAHDKIYEINYNWGAATTDIDPLRVISSNVLAAEGATLAQQQDARYGFRDWFNYDAQAVTTKAVFGQTEWRFAPAFSLTTGVRYTKDETSFNGCSEDRGDDSIAATWNAFFKNYLGVPSNVAPHGCVTYLANLTPYVIPNPNFVPLAAPPEFLLKPGQGPFPGQGVVYQSLSEDNVAGRVGLDWQATPNLLAYTYVARGFKSGAFPNVSANVASQFDPATQEEVITYEAGVKSRPLGIATVNGAIFYYDYRNKQVFGFVPDIVYGTLNRIVNIPKSHLYGAEAEVTVPLGLPGLVAHGTATYLKTRIDDYDGYDDFGIPRNFRGASFTFTPTYQANALVTYNFNINPDEAMALTFVGRYSGEQHGDLLDNPLFNIDSYVVMDANAVLSFDKGKYAVEGFVKNLANKYYWNSVQYNEDSVARYAGMPRTFGVTLKVKF